MSARAAARVQASFRLPIPLHRWLWGYARRNRLSVNQVVVMALELFRNTETEGEA